LVDIKKPELNENSLKLDSNENYVLSKQFQNNIVSGAIKNSDVREYPLGGVERLIKMISKFVKVPISMIGIGNGSDQILDLILSNFASKQTKVLTSNPTFGFFEERCKLYSIPLIAIPFSDDMKLNVKDFLKESKMLIFYILIHQTIQLVFNLQKLNYKNWSSLLMAL